MNDPVSARGRSGGGAASGGNDATRRRLTRLAVVALVLVSVAPRVVNLGEPLLEGNRFRQTQTAMTVWSMVEAGISPMAYPTPIVGPPWRIPFEFPLFQMTAALVARSGMGLDVACRVAAILWFYASAWFLYAFCRTRFTARGQTVFALLYYVWAPFTVTWSRACMIDFTSVALALGYAGFFARWLQTGRKACWILAMGLGVLTYGVKITTVAAIVPIMVADIVYWTRGLVNRESVQARRPSVVRILTGGFCRLARQGCKIGGRSALVPPIGFTRDARSRESRSTMRTAGRPWSGLGGEEWRRAAWGVALLAVPLVCGLLWVAIWRRCRHGLPSSWARDCGASSPGPLGGRGRPWPCRPLLCSAWAGE
jgi:hypothetical protein